MMPRNVLQCALQRQRDGEADCADGRDDRRGLHTELTEHHDHDQSEDGITRHLGEELPQCQVEAAAAGQGRRDGSLDQAGGEIAENEKEEARQGQRGNR